MRRFKRILFLFFFEFLRSTLSQESEKVILLQFKGNISDDPFNRLSSWNPNLDPCKDYNGIFCNSAGNVEKIVLWNLNLAGILSPSLSKLKSLRTLSLYGNRFTGNIPSEYAEIRTIWKLNLSSNALSGQIPDFIGGFQNLRWLDLSRNNFSDEIPSALFKSCFKTKFVSLSHNNLTGLIPSSISNCLNLIGFDFSFNNLTGNFPPLICELPSISYISVRSNSLEGNVQEQILMCKSLELLDLGSNYFTGLTPFDVLQFHNLSYLNASFNKFHGEIPEIKTCSDQMGILDVSGNDLVGEIPLSITNCRNIRVLDLGFNRLNGSIPVNIGNLKKLSVLRLSNNMIQGTLPIGISEIELLQILDLRNLQLSGEISDALSKCRFLLELDLSGNELQGDIPQTFYNMTYLKILDLHHNHLNGEIPSSLGELFRIQFFDLSENFLSGFIPSSLGNLTLLTHFNLSYNNLSGSIPLNSVIQSFDFTSFEHNPSLCGTPLNTSCSENGTRKTKVLSVSSIIAIVAAAIIFTGVCIISIMNIRARARRKVDDILALESTPPASTDSNLIIGKLVLFSKSLPSKYEDWEAGTKALLDKDCLIGGGSIGTVYKTNFEGGISIAVKKLETLGRIKNQDEFEQEIGKLGNLNHLNLVAFQGYYWSSSMQLVLSEFVSNSDLYQHLHGYIHPDPSTSTSRGRIRRRDGLHWSRRFQIALGTAKALAYLHHDCKPQVLHLNIKSTNILLDERYEPKLSDYGLVKLVPMLDNYGLRKFHNVVGYVAPELASQSLRFSDKCDVYSFGVILLELITGKKPVEKSSAETEVIVLCDYVRSLLERGQASNCFDRSLQGLVENELIQVMKLGLICTSEDPSRRPNMAEVVQVLESIRSG